MIRCNPCQSMIRVKITVMPYRSIGTTHSSNGMSLTLFIRSVMCVWKLHMWVFPFLYVYYMKYSSIPVYGLWKRDMMVTFLRILFPILRIKRRCIMVVEMQMWQAFSHNFSRLALTLFCASGFDANGVFGTNKKSYVRKKTRLCRPLQPPMRNFM